tara:strand:- start:1401 stop:1589 length:189 start_codon:yes stop_codon:yes gene_type:complete
MKLPSLQYLIRRYFRLPRKKLWIAALKINRAPVIWWDEKVEAKRKEKEIRQKKIESLYPKKK